MNFECVIAERKEKKIYKDGDRVIKLFDNNYKKTDILKEALNQARMEELPDLNIPRVLEVTNYDGKWAIVSDFISGNSLEKLIIEHPEKQEEYMELFINLQIKIHNMRCPFLMKLKDKMTEKINNSDFNNTIKYELKARIEAAPNHKCVCHGDFNPSNVIIRDDGTPFILDWAHVTEGNASADVARTYLVFCINGQEEFANKYLDRYCEITNTSKTYVQKWIPVVAATQLLKNKEGEKEILTNWVNVVDYE